LQYFWVDTCCIDKSNAVELQEAINSMFRWYQNAVKCYVYLSDVSIKKRKATDSFTEYTWEPAFRSSKWFTRGWTLQELVAPTLVEFFSKDQEFLGDKRRLERQIHEITGIAVSALQGAPLSQFDIEDRLSWADYTRRGQGILAIWHFRYPDPSPLWRRGKEGVKAAPREDQQTFKGQSV
jgi:hypothetical protein